MATVRELIADLDDPERRGAASSALYAVGEDDAQLIPELVAHLTVPSDAGRRMATVALGQIGTAAGVACDAIAAQLDDSDDMVRAHAMIALARIGWTDATVTARIERELAHAQPFVRIGAATALVARVGAPDAAIAMLVEISRTGSVAAQAWAVQGLQDGLASNAARVIPPLIALLDHWSDEFREGIGRSFALHDPAAVVPPLLAAWTPSATDEHRTGILIVLGYIGERARPYAREITALLGHALFRSGGSTGERTARHLRRLATHRPDLEAILEALPPADWVEDVLRDDVVDHPEDLAARLRYGRWLEAHGSPRGELVRLSIGAESVVDPVVRLLWETRAEVLLAEHREAWASHYSSGECEFRHGFVEHVTVWDLAEFSRQTPRLPEEPITSLTLRAPQAANGAAFGSFRASELHDLVEEWRERLVRLAIGAEISDEVLRALTVIGRSKIRALELTDCATDAAMRTLVDLQAPLDALSLDAPIGQDALSPGVIEALVCGGLPQLTTLRLACEIPSATLVEIFDAPEVTLAHLDLSGTDIDVASSERLARSEHLRGTTLVLRREVTRTAGQPIVVMTPRSLRDHLAARWLG